MIKPKRLEKGNKICIISLSSGMLGESYMLKQKALIEKRIHSFGLELVYTPHALKGIEYIENNPQARADDLIWAFKDCSIKAVMCAIGGEDTFKTIEYLVDNQEFISLTKNNPKIFIGYSDTTINHLLFYKLGLQTYYGHSAIVDMGELDKEMLSYSHQWFEYLFSDKAPILIKSSPIWYEERKSFGEAVFNTPRISHKEEHGFEVLKGSEIVSGRLFGGCLDSLGELLLGHRYKEQPCVNDRYELLPKESLFYKDKIIFLETAESKIEPKKLREYLIALEEYGLFEKARGLIIGKPQDEVYYQEYKEVFLEVLKGYIFPIIYNLNFGHAHPKCILPYGGLVQLDCQNKRVELLEALVI